ncbi:MAG: transcriptional repressor LexA [Armatimonadetes bacterium]|nr:transcriptional repressor LexA [Armatimonadota bacterium]
MPKPLSTRQRQILHYIQQHVEAHGYPPTVREIGTAVNLSSSSTVHAHLKALEEQGLIQRDAVLTRAIKVVSAPANVARPPAKAVVHVPIIGTVAAGKPRLAMEDIEDVFPLPQDFASGESFMLEVKGDSMIEDGIHEGDYVVVRRQPTADNGETVVAMVYDEASGTVEATVKRFFKERARIRLQPANKRMKPMHFTDVQIAGKVVGLVRRMA